MINIKRLTISSFIFLILVLGVGTLDTSAQSGRRVVRRPVIVRHYIRDPFWFDRYWYSGLYADRYLMDPYLLERRERYYKQKAVRDSARKLRKDREKYFADGVLTPKEEEKLAKRHEKYQKAVSKLREFNRDRDY